MSEKLYKVSYMNTEKKYAIVADSLKQLCVKFKKKLNIDTNKEVLVCLEDGTEIDSECFPFLEKDSVLIISLKDEAVPIKKQKLARIGNAFSTLIEKSYFVDKTQIIRSIIDLYNSKKKTNRKESPISIFAPRRFGKTAILDLLECFFGGGLPKETFRKLKIGADNDALDWYNRFTVIYITFGTCLDIIQNRDDCVRSCRLILHHTFRTYSYILDHLDATDYQAFQKWMDEEDYKFKTEMDVLHGLRFLIECVRSYYKNREVCLLIDEFDKMCSTAIYKTTGEDLSEIINFYSAMVSQVVKFDPICSISIFSGITPITCQAHSSLNNPIHIEFLNDDNFYHYYGITETEFEDIMARHEIPEKVKGLKQLAHEWYNGYSYNDIKIFNTYSVVNFIVLQTVRSYWRKSGLASGLWEAISSDSIRDRIRDLLDGISLVIELKELRPEDFCRIKDGCCKITDFNFIFTFLLQQGYLTITQRIENEKIQVKIPNKEVEGVYRTTLTEYYKKIFKFDPKKMDALYMLFNKMDFSNENDCKMKLSNFKRILIELLNDENRVYINEAWFEAFLFTIFFQNTKIQSQVKVERTARRKDIRTAKVLDLFVKINDKYVIIEETMIDSGDGALNKLLSKEYHKKIEEGFPFILIGIGVDNSQNGFNVSISYLANRIVGKLSQVL